MKEVVIVGGFASIRFYYILLKRILEQRGYHVSYVNSGPFGLNAWPLHVFLEDAKRRIEEIPGEIIGIGHSLGGIQTIWLGSLFPDKITKIFAICSPVWGAPIRFYEDVVLELLSVDRSEFERFKREIVPSLASRVVTVSSPNDGIAPTKYCAIPGAKNYEITKYDVIFPSPHLILPFCPATMQIIDNELSNSGV